MCGSYGAGSEKNMSLQGYRLCLMLAGNTMEIFSDWLHWGRPAKGFAPLRRTCAVKVLRGCGCCVLMGRISLTVCFFVRTVCLCTSLVWSDWEASHRQFGFALSCSSLNEGGKFHTGTFLLHPNFEDSDSYINHHSTWSGYPLLQIVRATACCHPGNRTNENTNPSMFAALECGTLYKSNHHLRHGPSCVIIIYICLYIYIHKYTHSICGCVK